MIGGDALTNCPSCNYDLSGDASAKSRGFLHVVVSLAYENWPDTHEQQFACADHLRAWLFCHPKVEHCWRDQISASIPAFADVVSARMADARKETGARIVFADASSDASSVIIRAPKTSARPGKGGPNRKAYYAIITRVLALIEDETGMSREFLKEEGRRASAPNRGFRRRAA
jgi:hypothetical protein